MSGLKGPEWANSKEKRLFDIVASISLSPIAAPTAIVGMTAFALETRLNPLFVQERVGRSAETLGLIKLRTMRSSRDYADKSDGYNDTRASRVGRVLRKLTIDEFPQLLQVINGTMSIVGPRPLVASEFDHTMDILSSKEKQAWLRSRTVVKPGLLSDFGNASRTTSFDSVDDSLVARADMDIRYAKEASRSTDLRIIREALGVVACREGNL